MFVFVRICVCVFVCVCERVRVRPWALCNLGQGHSWHLKFLFLIIPQYHKLSGPTSPITIALAEGQEDEIETCCSI